MYDTIIIGAGMSGLAAGIRLAHFEQRVCILERHTTIGGLNSFYRLNGRNYDVGLHAVTNYRPRGSRRGPLAKILRQLRFDWDDFALAPQVGSAVKFPGVTLRFNNDFQLLESEVRQAFPAQIDNFRRLVGELTDFSDVGAEATRHSARQVLAARITDPLLVEMLLCPLLFYGSAQPNDMEFGQFSIMFRSIFMEGMARPRPGVRLILKQMVRKYKALGGELRLRAGVQRIEARGGVAEKVVLDDGRELAARRILSSAGWRETMRLCGETPPQDGPPVGRITCVEAISVLDRPPRDAGFGETIVFFNDSERLQFEEPAELADPRSGVISSPSNFEYEEPLADHMIRVTALANHARWAALDRDDYLAAKAHWRDRLLASAARFTPDFRAVVIDSDVFTPTTIERFTGHERGAIYGSPTKRYEGTTHLRNLFLCGNDQGQVGIIGTLMSGVSIANQHLLRD